MREPLQVPPSGQRRHFRPIEIRHAAYPPTAQPLLRLAAVEGETDDDAGLDYDVAFLACAIVTGNTWSRGYFGQRQANDDGAIARVERPDDGILRDAVYYYLLEGLPTDYKYGVLASFDHWRFPHDNLPPIYRQTIIDEAPETLLRGKAAALARDGTCRMTGYKASVEAAHIIPEASAQWFIENQMTRYVSLAPESDATGGAANFIALRRDLHYLWDQGRFVLVPRPRGQQQQPRLELCVLRTNQDAQLVELYHNRPLQPMTGVSKECLLARFAWTIFAPRTMPFFKGSTEYVTLLFNPDTGRVDESKMRAAQILTKSHIFSRPAKSRSNSPVKRKLVPNADVEADCGASSASDDGAVRGRKRRRSWSVDEDDSETPQLDADVSFQSTEVATLR